jgi:hypothetical protein
LAYFGRETRAWIKAPRAPSHLLGFIFLAVRNGCNLEDGTNIRRQREVSPLSDDPEDQLL